MSVEQQINLKFLVRLGKTPTEALKLLQEVYGDDTMSRTGGGGGTTRPLPRDGGTEELCGDPTVGPHPKVWTIDRE